MENEIEQTIIDIQGTEIEEETYLLETITGTRAMQISKVQICDRLCAVT